MTTNFSSLKIMFISLLVRIHQFLGSFIVLRRKHSSCTIFSSKIFLCSSKQQKSLIWQSYKIFLYCSCTTVQDISIMFTYFVQPISLNQVLLMVEWTQFTVVLDSQWKHRKLIYFTTCANNDDHERRLLLTPISLTQYLHVKNRWRNLQESRDNCCG